MKCTVISNGKLQLLVSPESELEKMVLQQLSSGPVEIVMQEKLQVGEKALQDTIVITGKAVE